MRKSLDAAVSAICAPRRFARIAAEEELEEQLRNNPKSILETDRPAWVRSATPKYLTLIGYVRRSITMSLLLLVVAVVAAWILTAALRLTGRALDQSQIQTVRLASIAFLAWATLSRVGWKIQTFGGRTLPERFNDYWFRTLYFIGIVLGALSLWA